MRVVRTAAMLASVLVMALLATAWSSRAEAQNGRDAGTPVPTFKVDPAWPKVPSKWVLGLVSGVGVDSRDHIWVLHRPRTVEPADKQRAAPPVLEFDAAGTFIQAWGGPGQGYEWPNTEHGIAFDDRDNVWIAGSDRSDGQLLKFTKDGKFLLQIGKAGASKGNTDQNNVKGAADVTFYKKTNEIFVADGYNNRRIIVFDADTGRFKRMRGAFGNAPTDPPPPPPGSRGSGLPPPDTSTEGPGADQFNLVHSARISNDGLLYVADRANRRVQIFTPEGKYVNQVFISRLPKAPSTATGTAFGKPISQLADGLINAGMTASRTAFSPDKEQRYPGNVTPETAYELIIFDKRPDVRYRTGAIVGVAQPLRPVDAGGHWNTIEIVARGHRLSVTFNSVRTVDVEHTGRSKGVIALRCATGAVKFRRVEIRPLSPVS